VANKALLDFDPLTGRKITYVEEDGKSYIETKQDCSSIIDAAKQLSELPHNDKSLKPVALIPEEVLNQAILEGWFHDKAKWRAWANNPDNKLFRITQGRL
jgi:ribosomal protein S2